MKELRTIGQHVTVTLVTEGATEKLRVVGYADTPFDSRIRRVTVAQRYWDPVLEQSYANGRYVGLQSLSPTIRATAQDFATIEGLLDVAWQPETPWRDTAVVKERGDA